MPTGSPNSAFILVGGGASASVVPIPITSVGTATPIDIEFSGEASPTARHLALNIDPGDIDPLVIEMAIVSHQLLSGKPISLSAAVQFTTTGRLTREFVPKDLGTLSASVTFSTAMYEFRGPAVSLDPETVTFGASTTASLAPDPNSFGAWTEDESGKAKMRIRTSAMLSLLQDPADEPNVFAPIKRISQVMSDYVLNERGHPQ